VSDYKDRYRDRYGEANLFALTAVDVVMASFKFALVDYSRREVICVPGFVH
jgi:hypothetical protein